jgi:dTDP-glucose pyrophosphorylase
MDYTIYDAIQAGFEKVVFVIRRDMEVEFREQVLGKVASGISTEIVYQELNDLPDGLRAPEDRKKPWGTAHAVWASRNAVQTPFAMVNADDFYGRSSLQTIHTYLSDLSSKRLGACLVGFKLKNTLSDFGSVSRGICKVDQDGNLVSIEERTNISKEDGRILFREDEQRHYLTGNETASMNLIGLTPEVFGSIEKGLISFFESNATKPGAEYYIPDVLKKLIDDGLKVPVLPTSAKWFGVTYKKDRNVVQQQLLNLHHKGIYPAQLHFNKHG